jgi:hypothetical protein
MCTPFSPLMGRFFNHFFRQCVILGKANEYNHATIVLHPMTQTIPSENTIAAMFQLHTLSFKPYPFTYF